MSFFDKRVEDIDVNLQLTTSYTFVEFTRYDCVWLKITTYP